MSSLVILAAYRFLRYRAENRQTDRQNGGENPTIVTAVGLSNKNRRQNIFGEVAHRTGEGVS